MIYAKNLYQFTKYFCFKQKKSFLALFILHLAWSIDQTVLPFVFKKFLDVIINYQGDKSDIWAHIALWVWLGATIWLLNNFMFRSWDYISTKTFPTFEKNVRLFMIDYLNQHSYEFFQNNFAGSIANKISDMTDNLTQIIQSLIILFVPSLVAFIIGSSFFFWMHPIFAILLILWCFLHLCVCYFLGRKCGNLAKIHAASKSSLSGKIVDNFSNIFAIKSYAAERRQLAYLAKYQNDEFSKHRHVLLFDFKIRLILGIVCFAFQGVLNTIILVKFWQLEYISATDMVYIFYTNWGLTIMAWISGTELPRFFQAIGKAKQALELIQTKHEIKDTKNANDHKILEPKIVFENVSFSYQRNDNIFANQNIVISPCSKIGLVGYSGSGKTTFVNLIMRYFEINDGSIKIDNKNIRDYTLNSLRNQISLIPQDPLLFHRSIYDNIAFGIENISRQDVKKAAEFAYADQFINDLPNGYDTLVGERGVKLSGGQRQRIAIARAFLKNSPIIILDEATSALDSVTENHIQNSIEELSKGKTTIIIAHRLSTLRNVDRILVFDKGSIIQDGSHQELIKVKGHYQDLWQKQSNGFVD